jgi:hypothetical protein
MSQSRYIEWFGIAVSPSVIRRSVCYAMVVGSLLILINHGACILDEMYTPECFLQSILSVIVPYIVVTVSSVQATISNEGNVK